MFAANPLSTQQQIETIRNSKKDNISEQEA